MKESRNPELTMSLLLNAKKIRTFPRMRHPRDIPFLGDRRNRDIKFRGEYSMFGDLAQRVDLVVNGGK